MSSTQRFIEEMGLISQESGDSRISGQILGLLVTEGEALSLGQISERLAVSRASVSTNARQLARRGIIKLTSHAGDRQDYYQVSGIPYLDMLAQMTSQFDRHARTLKECVEGMRQENSQAAERAADLQGFFESSTGFFQSWADALRRDAASRKDEK